MPSYFRVADSRGWGIHIIFFTFEKSQSSLCQKRKCPEEAVSAQKIIFTIKKCALYDIGSIYGNKIIYVITDYPQFC